MRPWLVWTIGVALLVAAWGVVQLTPVDDDAQRPFVIPAAVGETASGRAFEITVTDARIGDRAVASGWQADGTWLVVDLEASARGEEAGASLDHAVFVVDGVAYRASERPDSFFESALSVGIARTGSIAFELPENLSERTGVLHLALDDETRLDSLVEVPLDLAALERDAEVELLPDGWAS